MSTHVSALTRFKYYCTQNFFFMMHLVHRLRMSGAALTPPHVTLWPVQGQPQISFRCYRWSLPTKNIIKKQRLFCEAVSTAEN